MWRINKPILIWFDLYDHFIKKTYVTKTNPKCGRHTCFYSLHYRLIQFTFQFAFEFYQSGNCRHYIRTSDYTAKPTPYSITRAYKQILLKAPSTNLRKMSSKLGISKTTLSRKTRWRNEKIAITRWRLQYVITRGRSTLQYNCQMLSVKWSSIYVY